MNLVDDESVSLQQQLATFEMASCLFNDEQPIFTVEEVHHLMEKLNTLEEDLELEEGIEYGYKQ